MDDTTTISGPGGCIEFLTDIFHEKYPLISRRYDYFSLAHKSGQKFSDFTAKLMKVAREAAFANIPIEQLHVFRYIMACQDAKLKEKILEF